MKQMKKLSVWIVSACLLSVISCKDNNTGSSTENGTNDSTVETPLQEAKIPEFYTDSAYNFIAKQVSFGPRTPGSEAQLNCAAWLQQKLSAYCDTVYRQQTNVTAGDGSTQLRCINLIGVIKPEAKYRILFLAHWDSRPWADRDVANKNKPILGANDGASGVGVLLALAQTLQAIPLSNTDIGIDILFADVEDYGKSEWGDDSYALGTQYWARNPHVPGYRANGGILLDMVGGKNARFALEGHSKQFAGDLQIAVWSAAYKAGFSSYFLNENGGYITDDHVPVNEILGIPTIDIIDMPANSNTGFPTHWHTHGDNMDVIDKATLKAVGQTLLQFLYTR